MGKLAFGIWDALSAHEMATAPAAAYVYERHIREAQLAEELGYR